MPGNVCRAVLLYHHRKLLHCVLIETCKIDYHLLPYSYIDVCEAIQREAALERLVDALDARTGNSDRRTFAARLS